MFELTDEQIIRVSASFLRTAASAKPGPDMRNLWHDCGSPSCAAGYLRDWEGHERWRRVSRVEIILDRADIELGVGGFWSAVFGSSVHGRKISLADLGIDMSPGANIGPQALRDAANRLLAVGALALERTRLLERADD